jgi:hypothetical protein
MVNNFLYLPDYPIGHLIAFQIEEQIEKAGNLGAEFERMAKLRQPAAGQWMKNATGAPVGAAALLHATEKALEVVKDSRRERAGGAAIRLPTAWGLEA